MAFVSRVITLAQPLEGMLLLDLYHIFFSMKESILTNRNAFRINKGLFSLDGKQYQLAINSGNNHNHGGVKGYDKVGCVNCLFLLFTIYYLLFNFHSYLVYLGCFHFRRR